MKRLMSILLVLVLLTSAGLSGAEEPENHTPVDKLLGQLSIDGLVAGIRVRAEGDGDWVKTLSPLSGKEFRLIFSHGEDALYGCLYRNLNGEHFGETEMYADKEDVYLRSDFLMDTVLRLGRRGDLFTSIGRIGQEGNPLLYSFLIRMLLQPVFRWEEKWDPALNSLRKELEIGLSEYAEEPRTVSEDGVNAVIMGYRLNGDQLKKVMTFYVSTLLSDNTLTEMLRGQMTNEQAALYLQPGLLWYYNRAIESLPLTGEVMIERRLSLQGKELSTALTLPLPGSLGFDTARIETGEENARLTLTGKDKEAVIVSRESERSDAGSRFEGDFLLTRAGEQTIACTYDVRSVVTDSTDDNQVVHQVTTWTINVTDNPSLAPEADRAAFEPIQARLRTHLYSKDDKRTPSTLEVQSSFTLPGGTLSVTIKLVIAESDEITAFDTTDAIDLRQVSEEKRREYLNDFWLNLLLSLTDTPADGTPEEPAAEPAEEPQEEPAEEPADAPQDGPAADAPDGEDSSDGTDELPAENTEETVSEDAPEAGDESGAPADAES